MTQALKLGLVPAHRGFFSAELAAKARQQIIEVMRSVGVEVVVPDQSLTPLGCVGSMPEAVACAELFRRQSLHGVVIAAVNFGDEQAAATVVREMRCALPILLVGSQEEAPLQMGQPRRDSFCGLLSIAEALRQLGATYTVARRPIVAANDPALAVDVARFAAVCRVVHGLRNARYGQVGTRPEAFWTCRFSEVALQRLGPTTVVLDLSEALAGAAAIASDDPELHATVAAIRAYGNTSAVPDEAITRSARFELFLRRWRKEQNLDALAVQCWLSIQKNLGVCACTSLSRLSDSGVPAACEADILGAMSMHALQLASQSPAALADWNNLHNSDAELVNLWHCGVFPKAFARSQPVIKVHEILREIGMAKESQGTVEFVARASPVTLCRITQSEDDARAKAVLVEGRIEDNPAMTFGSYGWCRIPRLTELYRDVLLRHFPHHVALSQGHCGAILDEALSRYLGLQLHTHSVTL